MFDLLYPASSSLSIYPSRSGWGGRKSMPPSNPSQEEMGDSDSGPKCLGKEGALSSFCYIRQRSVGKPCTLASGQYLMIRSICSSSASVLQQQRGSTWKGGACREATSLSSGTCHPCTCSWIPVSCLSTLLCDPPWPTDH